MRTMATDDPGICQSACHAVSRGFSKTAVFEVLFGMKTLGGPMNIALDPDPLTEEDSMRPSPKYFGHLFTRMKH